MPCKSYRRGAPRTSAPIQHLAAAKPLECRTRLVMLDLRLPQHLRERRLLSYGVEPRVANHGGKAEEAAGDDAFEHVERRIHLVQACQVPRQVEQSLGIAEVR